MRDYLPRIYDAVLVRRLAAKGAVLVEGPKWCGKTTTCERVAASSVLMQDPRTRDESLQLADVAPLELLAGATPHLIDEWQMAPRLWDAVRFEVDRRGLPGQFILTGSAVPVDLSQVDHTGTGRIARMRMRPMASAESGDSTGDVSLAALLRGGEVPVLSNPTDIHEVAFLCCRGGWPTAVGLPREAALDEAFDYVEAVAESDVSRVDGVARDSTKVRAILRSYARLVGGQAPETKIVDDLGASQALGESTVRSYLAALRKIFVVDDLGAWNPNLRSRAAVRTSPTRMLCDPSLVSAALEVYPEDLVGDLETLGLVFESLCVRDLRVYADASLGSVSHFRDKNGLEVDAVVRSRGGAYGLVEVKLGGERAIEQGAETLRRIAERIDTTKMRAPAFLMVLTGVGNRSYTRSDGVAVVPFCLLGP